MKTIIYYVLYLAIAILILPYIVSSFFEKDEAISSFYKENYDMEIDFNNAELQDSFEEYIVSVVAAEMPALYETEALKAQAVCARTYAYRQIEAVGYFNKDEIAQSYLSQIEMEERWGGNFDLYYNKIRNAVEETKGEIIKYEDEPIAAVFHAMSGGATEYSENVWQSPMPYLVSVDSSFDEEASGYLTEYVFTYDEIKEKLKGLADVDLKKDKTDIEVTEKSDAGYVTQVRVNDTVLTGNEFRSLLGLRSTNFEIQKNSENIYITTKGYGHGVGLSQTGANYLAGQGYGYKDILTYYYKGVYIEEL